MHRYKFDRSSKKYICPACGQNRFVKLIDSVTGEYCSSEYGKCDRELNCGFRLFPKSNETEHNTHHTTNTKHLNNTPNSHFNDNKPSLTDQKRPYTHQTPTNTPIKPPYITTTGGNTFDFIEETIFQSSIALLEKNNFFQWLAKKFSYEKALKVCRTYGVGSNPYIHKQTAFWQIDADGKKRTAELIQYNFNGKRDRTQHPNWIHAMLKKRGQLKEFNLEQCGYGIQYIGQHTHQRIAVVEGAKTAIVCAMVYPEYHWIGTAGVHGLNTRLLSTLPHTNTILIPDSGYEGIWRSKSNNRYQILSLDNFIEEGGDLADIVTS